MTASVLILGGGIIGLSSAWECKRLGYDVTLLEIGQCGGQASGAAAGMLAPFSENVEQPDAFFELCLESFKLYPEWIDAIERASGQRASYIRSGSLHVVYHEADRLHLESRLRWQNEFGARAELWDRARLTEEEPFLSPDIVAALHYPEEAHVYAPHYVKALEAACRRAGVTIRDGLETLHIEQWEASPVIIKDRAGQSYSGDHVVVATGAWLKELETTFGLQLPVFPIRGQICAYDQRETSVSLNRIVYGSQGYLVPKENGSLVCGASEDIAGFVTDITERGISRLERWSGMLVPVLRGKEPFHRWAGLRPATQDGFPFSRAVNGSTPCDHSGWTLPQRNSPEPDYGSNRWRGAAREHAATVERLCAGAVYLITLKLLDVTKRGCSGSLFLCSGYARSMELFVQTMLQ